MIIKSGQYKGHYLEGKWFASLIGSDHLYLIIDWFDNADIEVESK